MEEKLENIKTVIFILSNNNLSFYIFIILFLFFYLFIPIIYNIL